MVFRESLNPERKFSLAIPLVFVAILGGTTAVVEVATVISPGSSFAANPQVQLAQSAVPLPPIRLIQPTPVPPAATADANDGICGRQYDVCMKDPKVTSKNRCELLWNACIKNRCVKTDTKVADSCRRDSDCVNACTELTAANGDLINCCSAIQRNNTCRTKIDSNPPVCNPEKTKGVKDSGTGGPGTPSDQTSNDAKIADLQRQAAEQAKSTNAAVAEYNKARACLPSLTCSVEDQRSIYNAAVSAKESQQAYIDTIDKIRALGGPTPGTEPPPGDNEWATSWQEIDKGLADNAAKLTPDQQTSADYAKLADAFGPATPGAKPQENTFTSPPENPQYANWDSTDSRLAERTAVIEKINDLEAKLVRTPEREQELARLESERRWLDNQLLPKVDESWAIKNGIPNEQMGKLEDWNKGYADADTRTWWEKNAPTLLGGVDAPAAPTTEPPAGSKAEAEVPPRIDEPPKVETPPKTESGKPDDWTKDFNYETAGSKLDKTADDRYKALVEKEVKYYGGDNNSKLTVAEEKELKGYVDAKSPPPLEVKAEPKPGDGVVKPDAKKQPPVDASGNRVSAPGGGEAKKQTDGGSGAGNIMGALGSMLQGLMKALGSPQPSSAPAQACSTDPNVYAQQQQQYQQQLQQYNYQLQQYQYQQQMAEYQSRINGGFLTPPTAPTPIQPTPCRPSNADQCRTQVPQPSASACTAGSWQPVYSGSCIVNWNCSTGTGSPKATLSCAPEIADVGQSIELAYSCSSGVATSSSFAVASQPGGTSTAIVKNPPQGTNTATYTLACTEGGKTTGAQCSVKIAKSSIILVANPKTVAPGGTTLVSWLTTGMDSCVVSSPDIPGFTAQNEAYTSVSGAATTSPLTSAARFHLECLTLAGGTKSATTTVSVTGVAEDFSGGLVEPHATVEGATVSLGTTTRITWRTVNPPPDTAISLWLVDLETNQPGRLIAGARPTSGSYDWHLPSANDACTTDTPYVCASDLVSGQQYAIEANLYAPTGADLGEPNTPANAPLPTFLEFGWTDPFTME